jgi:hypothetical protein
VLQALLIPPVLYLSGHFLGSCLARKGDGLFEQVLLRIIAAFGVAGPLLTLLALAGWFTTPVILGASGACAVAAYLLARGGSRGARATVWDLVGFTLVAGSLALYSRPAEYVLNSRDPGVYVLFADKLARTGALLHRDPLVAAVSSFHHFAEGKKYPGFYLYAQDLVVPQFFPGPFAFLGLGNLVGGLWGSLFVVPVMGALAVGVAFALGRELFGSWTGLVGAALLAASYTQVWWARHPSSEVMSQLFILAGLWLAARFLRGAGPVSGVVSGVLLGAAMVIRVDAFLAATAVAVTLGYDVLTRGNAARWLYPGVPLAVFAGITLLYLNTVGGRYLYVIYTEHGLREAMALAPFAAGVAALAAAGSFYVRRRWGERLADYLEARGRWIPTLGALCVVAVALWAYFVLPVPWDSLPDGSRDFDAYRTQILVRMTWFTTPAVAALGLAGLVLAARRLDAPRALVLGAFLGFGVLYAAIPNVSPDLPWATRRFVPAVFPILGLLAGHAAVEAGRWVGLSWRRKAGMVVGAALALLAFGWTVHTSSFVVGFRELEGAVVSFDRIEREIPVSEVVYMEMPEGFDVTASTFEYAYARPVLPYDRIRFVREVDDLAAAGLLEDAVYVTTDGGPAPLLADVDFREVAAAELNLPRLSAVEKELPTQSESLRLSYRVFRVEEEGG